MSTHYFQPNEVPNPNSKRMGMGNAVPRQMLRLGIEEAKGAQETLESRQPRESHTWPGGGGE